MLRALHGHLGTRAGGEASAALGVLCTLAREHTAVLMRYAAFLTAVLDYVDTYTGEGVYAN